MSTVMLNDISKGTKAKPETFVALAGEIKKGNELLAGLEIGVDSEWQYRAPDIMKPYLQVVSDMGIDFNYASFYHADKSSKEKFYDINTAILKYNETILSKGKDSQEVGKYLIRNIPDQAQELSMAYIKGELYGSNPESCIVLNSSESQEQSGSFTVLICQRGEFAIVEDVRTNRFGKLDLQSVSRPTFNIDDIQTALDEYAGRVQAKGEEEHTADEIKENLEQFSDIRVGEVKAIMTEMNRGRGEKELEGYDKSEI